MGYRIWSLANIPVNDVLDLYIFSLGDRHWSQGPSASIEQNFKTLARELGRNAAIVVGHEGANLGRELATSLERTMQGWSETAGNWPALREFVFDAERAGPAILILGAHPDKLTEDDLVLYAPLRALEKSFGSMDAFFDSLCNFARLRNADFLHHFKSESRFADMANMLELKPNFAGIGINLNEVIRRLEIWWRGQAIRQDGRL